MPLQPTLISNGHFHSEYLSTPNVLYFHVMNNPHHHFCSGFCKRWNICSSFAEFIFVCRVHFRLQAVHDFLAILEFEEGFPAGDSVVVYLEHW